MPLGACPDVSAGGVIVSARNDDGSFYVDIAFTPETTPEFGS